MESESALSREYFAWIERPTLLLDAERVLANIAAMAQRATQAGVRLRPHFKTHQSATIGAWFRAAGVTCATVSSLDMAAYFAEDGWNDLTVAFPTNTRQIGLINRLAAQITLGLLVDNPAPLQRLQAALEHPVQLWIEIDTGQGRSGVAWNDEAALIQLARQALAGPNTRLAGLLTHGGHSYNAHGHAEIAAVTATTRERLLTAQATLTAAGLPLLPLSLGDTPGCSVSTAFPGIAEIRPGNFVFYDLTQLAIGSCRETEIAVALAAPVVGHYPERGKLVIHGGAVHLAKDVLALPDGTPIYGQVALLTAHGWGALIPGAYVHSLSQEHGVIAVPPELIKAVAVGDLVAIVPVHSCHTADAMGGYYTLDGTPIAMFRGPHG